MSRQLILDGVPDCIRRDGWWLASDSTSATEDAQPSGKSAQPAFLKRHPIAFPALVFLVLLADWLFWQRNLGVSVALFALAICSVILALKPGGASRRQTITTFVFELACNLPVMEQLQPLSLLFSFAGVITLAGWVAYEQILDWWQLLAAFLRISTKGASLLPFGVAKEIKAGRVKVSFKQRLKDLVLPVSVGLVFLVLLSSANPMLERFLDQFSALEFLSGKQLARGVFWIVAASLIWPYLNLREKWLGPIATAPKTRAIQSSKLDAIVNPISVRNSLVLFNLMFLAQTAMDIGVLTGGMSLPEGMSHASYAHRGAYPLVATALLAGVFAIATHKMIRDDRFQQALMYLWLGQNLFLVITAAYRLQLYVKAYSLTYLRIAAFIWMLLVFVGLILTIVKITRSKRIFWLLSTNMATLMATLYLCCFVNFAYVIADYNLNHTEATTRKDEGHICALGEQALPSILQHEEKTGRKMCQISYYPRPKHEPISNWREWGFRRGRLQAYLSENYYR